ncbi:MAG TPA: nucleotide exchange factor GrpE [Candidatus Desulfofervidus auxilii]|uniref:Protein GrpE n=1 Tax=Desulfofervidus auxilii TaxID=1621989 RepID=A0A7C0Y3N1_DESA2|nr:nucleotide exchange factor GrpE [Candidatus Desulfofervidus auxilii]
MSEEEKKEKEKEQKVEEIDKIKKELEDKTKEAAKYREEWLRALAELDNFRKRAEKERSDYFKFANEQLIKEILPILDNLERAINHGQSSNDLKGLLEGVKLTLKMLNQCLEKFGVKPIEAKGQKFDPNFHEVIRVEEKEDVEEGSIIEVYQKGYLLHDRLLRPALVVVAKGKTQ